jgi:hypothetical protein
MRKGKVVRPRGSKPQVLKASTDKYAALKATLKRGGGKSKSQTKGNKTIEYKDLDKNSKKNMRGTILVMSTNGSSTVSSTIMSSDTGTPSSASGPIVFMITAPVFNMTPPSRCVLPVPIQGAFLHIANFPAIRSLSTQLLH